MSDDNNEDPATETLLRGGDNEENNSIQHLSTEKYDERSQLVKGTDQENEGEEEGKKSCCTCCGSVCGLLKRYKYMFMASGFFVMNVITLSYGPMLPKIKKDYFGSAQRAGGYQSLFDCSSALLGMFTAGFYGKLQDTFGRKPFFIAFAVAQAVLVTLLLIFEHNPLPFMFANVFARLLAFSFAMAFLADHFEPAKRSIVFGAIQALAGLASLCMIMVAFLPQTLILIIACSFAGANLLYAIFVVRESLDPELLIPFSWSLLENPFKPVIRTCRSKLMRGAMVVIACIVFATVGAGEVYNFYLMERVNFTKEDFAINAVISGLLAPVVMFGLLPLMLRVMSDILVMILCTVLLVINLVIIATAWAKWPIFAFVTPMQAVISIASPILLSIVSSSGDPQEQGQRISCLLAIVDLFSAFGPLCFGQIYMHINGAWVALPFVIAALFCIPPIFVLMKMKKYRDEEIVVKRTSSIIARSASKPPEVKVSEDESRDEGTA